MVMTDGRFHVPCCLFTPAGKGLEQFTTDALAEGFQTSGTNTMLGTDSRAHLLRSLGKSLLTHPEVFGTQGRPGNLVGKDSRSWTATFS